MIARILLFELRYRFTNPLTLLFVLLMAGQGVWYTFGIYKYFTSDESLVNGSGVFYQCLAVGGILVIVIVAMMTASGLNRDRSCRSAGYVYASPVNEKLFFWGHFLGAYTINCCIVLAYPIGMILVKYIGIAEPHLLGPVPLLQLAHGFLIFSMPNLFILSVICYVCLIFTRKISAVYIGMVVVAAMHALCDTMSVHSAHTGLLSMIDPFGSVYTWQTLSLMPVKMKNTAFLPLTPVFYLNRFLWICVSLIGLWLCSHKFSFKYFYQNPAGRKKDKREPVNSGYWEYPLRNREKTIPSVSLRYGFSENIKKVLRLSITEFLSVVRPTSFRIVFTAMVLFILLIDLFLNTTYYIGHQLPVTSAMTYARVTNGFLFTLILMIWSGELFFREKTTAFWQIAGTSPTPNWVQQLPKLIAMAGVAFLVALSFFVGGLAAQLIQGFFQINFSLYLYDLFGYNFGWLTYVLNIIFVFFLAGVTGNRYLTHVLSTGLYIFLLFSFDLHLIEQIRFGYAIVPGASNYSEMNGYGIWAKAGLWYFFMWASIGLCFVLFSLQVWKRGEVQRFFDPNRLFRGELRWPAKSVFVILLWVFFYLQVYIIEHVNKQRNYVPSDQVYAEAAAYEKKYRQPLQRTRLDLGLHEVKTDFYPKERRAEYWVSLWVKNPGKRPVDRLYLNIDYFTQVHAIRAGHKALRLVEQNRELGMSVYLLEAPLAPADKIQLFVHASRQYKGFSQSTGFTLSSNHPQGDLSFNGVFFTTAIPFIGFDEKKSLQENKIRKRYGLANLSSRLPKVHDESALRQNFVSPLKRPKGGVVNITVSTSVPQQPFAPGKLIARWNENGRNYAKFTLDKGKTVQPYMGSAVYASHIAMVAGVEVNFLYHPDHDDNLWVLTEAVKNSFDFINKNLGTYSYASLRIAEIPYYQKTSYPMANAIAISEKECWYVDAKIGEIQGYIQFILARDLIRQWLISHKTIARVQGADMLWSALPSALALQVVKENLGSARVNELMNRFKKKYHKERCFEPNSEPSLLYGDNIEYLEKNKGTMALYRLSESMEFHVFNQKISNWIAAQGTPLVFKDLYLFLQEQEQFDGQWRALFETVETAYGL